MRLSSVHLLRQILSHVPLGTWDILGVHRIFREACSILSHVPLGTWDILGVHRIFREACSIFWRYIGYLEVQRILERIPMIYLSDFQTWH